MNEKRKKARRKEMMIKRNGESQNTWKIMNKNIVV
jgi:hypothetical protein